MTTYAHQITLGDSFVILDGRSETRVGPVAGASTSSDGRQTRVDLGDGSDSLSLHAYLPVRIVESAPKCGCGEHFLNCEEDCTWPEWLDDLWFASRI